MGDTEVFEKIYKGFAITDTHLVCKKDPSRETLMPLKNIILLMAFHGVSFEWALEELNSIAAQEYNLEVAEKK